MTEQSGIIIRSFELKFLDQVTEINRICLPENYPEHFFRTIHSELPSGFLICEVDSQVVGYTMARLESGMSHFSLFHRARKGHTVSLAVLPPYRRQGLGTKLLKESMTAMIAAGANELFLEVRVSNQPAISLYHRAGYQIVKEIRHYYRDYEAAYLMALKVPKTHQN
ncbi:MAG: ribosomal protein S18-alanine N-acetyltransferase [Candidatus Heimdallarchaeota archaeon]